MKKKLFILCVVIIILSVIFFLRPIQLYPLISDNNIKSLQITHIEGTRDFSKPPHQNLYRCNYAYNSDEYNAICKLLKKYYYHMSFSTLTKDTTFKGTRDDISIKSNKHEIVLSNKNKILIDGTPYRVGYLGNSKSESLTKELLFILKGQ